ncbi:sialate O-acetylesterase [Rhodococcus qingshengii]|uniref:sialate O-acetylesterase n=1 Tax=Rhodococcus qingshengii TaxID=334542 RepID=UPI001C5DFEFF|nr:sialate O-acetylesterase [Rhodococcus qingshengii]MBW4813355.1 sialate O-acetylesterase [Rhodococcus qingshengii]
MADQLIPYSDSAAAGQRLPAAVRTEIGQVPAVAAKIDKRGACHIIAGLGQSNMTQADASLPGVAALDYRCYRWDWNTNTIVQMTAAETYLLPAFAREYANTLPAGDWILIVPAAIGSTGFTSTSITPAPAGYHNYGSSPGTWDRTLTADPVNLVPRAVNMINAAKAAALLLTGTVTIDALLWSQGEEDTPFLTESEYAAKLDDLIAFFRTSFSDPVLPFVVGSLVPEYAAARGQVNTAGIAAALSATPQRTGNSAVAFVYGPEGLPKNNEIIHYSTQGQLQRGRLFLDGLRRARLNRAAALPMPPEIVGISREQSGKITAQWRYPQCRYTGFDVEFSFDGGATYSAGTLEKDSRLKAFTMAFAWEPVRMRIRSKADGSVTVSPWAYSIELPSVRDVPTSGAPFKFVGGENLSPALAGALTMYSVFTLPASGGEATVNARATDSSRQMYLSAAQTSSTDIASLTTGGGTQNLSFPAPKAVSGQHINAAAVSADGVAFTGKRGVAAAATLTGTAGNVLAETLRVNAQGGAVVHGAYLFPQAAHTGTQMSAWQEFFRIRHGYDGIGGVA